MRKILDLYQIVRTSCSGAADLVNRVGCETYQTAPKGKWCHVRGSKDGTKNARSFARR